MPHAYTEDQLVEQPAIGLSAGVAPSGFLRFLFEWLDGGFCKYLISSVFLFE